MNVEADDASWTYIAFETHTWGVRVVHASNGESVRDVELESAAGRHCGCADGQMEGRAIISFQRGREMGCAGGRCGSCLLLDRTCMREGRSRDSRTTLKRRRGDSQGVDNTGCGFWSSDAGRLVNGKADERLFCRGWLMIYHRRREYLLIEKLPELLRTKRLH